MWERSILEKFVKHCSSPWEESDAGVGEQCGEGAVEIVYDLTTTLHPPFPCYAGEEVDDLGVKLV